MITINQYKQAKQELKKLNEEGTILREQHDKEGHLFSNKYWELERKLSDRKYNEKSKLTKRHEKEKDKISKQEVPYVTITSEYSRIIRMMEVHKEYKKPEIKVYKYDYLDKIQTSYAPIDTIKDDKYTKIQVFIIDNNKPKNKFSLIVAGCTIFPEKIIKPQYYYGLDCHTTGANILRGVIDKPTQEELKSYYGRNKSKIFKQFLIEHKEVEKEYENIIVDTDNKEWEVQYWEHRKEYYELHYCRGTETPEYKQVLGKLLNLGKSPKEKKKCQPI